MTEILILYAEVMPYTYSMLKDLVYRCESIRITVVSWNSKKLTSYQLDNHSSRIVNLDSDDYNAVSLCELVKELNPNLLLVSGRMENKYLKATRYAKKRGVTTIGFSDNQFNGGIKDWLKIMGSHFLYKRYFEYLNVAGIRQYHMSKLLGYHESKIIMPQYVADLDTFFTDEIYSEKQFNNKRILFVGRLEPVKGLGLLLEAFKQFSNEYKNWELIIIGNGSLQTKIQKEKDNIKYYEFMSQAKLKKIANTSTIFCLPSQHEPWGVVVQEFAAVGLPLLISWASGAGDHFVKPGMNGYRFSHDNIYSLIDCFKIIAQKDYEELKVMSEWSKHLSKTYTSNMWSEQILNLIK